MGRALDRIGDPRHPAWPGSAARDFDGLTTAALLRREGASEGAVQLVRLGYLDEWGDGVDHTSALAALRDLALNERPGALWRIAGGTDRLPAALAALGAQIRYGVDAGCHRIGDARRRGGGRRRTAGVRRGQPSVAPGHRVAGGFERRPEPCAFSRPIVPS